MGNRFFKRSAVLAYGLPLIITIATITAVYVAGTEVEIDASDDGKFELLLLCSVP